MTVKKNQNGRHEPVLLKEAIEALHIQTGAYYIDATLGAGGHSSEIIRRGGFVIGIETDESNIERAKKNLMNACPAANEFSSHFTILHGNFRNIDTLVNLDNFGPISGILFDLGVSNFHFLDPKRGFSYKFAEAELDMRLDPSTQSLTGADLVNSLREDQLMGLFSEALGYGDAKRISQRIVKNRPVTTVGEFLEATELAGTARDSKTTEVFMALRMAVNSELETIGEALPKAIRLLKNSGKLVVISFHSGEDRVVKHVFHKFSSEGYGRELTDKPITPSEEEMEQNKKSRSAKMRVFERIGNENI